MDHTVTPKVAVVIVSYNTRTLLLQAVHSALHDLVPTAVVVIDNASHDGSPEAVAATFPEVTLIRNTQNRGFAAATNQGIDATCVHATPYVLLLNPDAQLLPGALATMVAFMEQHPRVGCVGPRLIYPDGRFQEGAWHFPTPLMTLFDLFPPRGPLLGRLQTSSLNGRYRAEHGTQPFPIDHPLGAAMLIRRATLDEVGLLDPSYWMYAEEVDWCRRAKAAGWAIWQVPQAQVVHWGGASSQQFRGRSLIALHRSRLQFFTRWEDAPTVTLHRVLFRLGMLWATLRTWAAWFRGRATLNDLRSRLAAYGAIMRL